jgi:hypothetical protein
MAQRTGFALAQALRDDCPAEPLHADGRIRRVSDLLIAGVEHDRLPDALDRARMRQPHSAAALAINCFLPWQAATTSCRSTAGRGSMRSSSWCGVLPACVARRRIWIFWRCVIGRRSR